MTAIPSIVTTSDNASINGQTYNVGETVAADGTKTTAKQASTLDKDSFLKLLVAQLKYQTPDNPMDSSALMAQSAQFSQLEAIQGMQASQTQLLNAQNSTVATGMLGQKIVFTPAAGGADTTGTVTGVKLGTDGPVLKVGDTEVPLSSVKEVDRAS